MQKVEQDRPEVFIGSVHYCTFENYRAIISPLRMTLSDEEIFYAESCQIKEMDLSLVHEFVFRNVNDNACIFAWRYLNTDKSPVPDEITLMLSARMQQIAESLKAYCEKDQNLVASNA